METNDYAEEVAIDAQVQEWDAKAAENNPSYIKMDFSLETPDERNELVKKIIADTPPEKLTKKYIEKLADYIIDNSGTIDELRNKAFIFINYIKEKWRE